MEDPAFTVFLGSQQLCPQERLPYAFHFSIFSRCEMGSMWEKLPLLCLSLCNWLPWQGRFIVHDKVAGFSVLFLYKNNKNWNFSCTPFCQLQYPYVCLSISFVWHTQEANSVLCAFEVGGRSSQSWKGWRETKDRVGKVWVEAGKTVKVICKFAFCVLTDRGKCKILLSYFAI